MHPTLRFLAVALAGLFLCSCQTIPSSAGKKSAHEPAFTGTGEKQTGKASWYSVRTNGGHATASGESLDENAATAAHRQLPLGTWVKVTNQVNSLAKVVRINDRGPYIAGRIIDVTIGVARELDFVGRGVVPVTVEVMNNQTPQIAASSTGLPPKRSSLFASNSEKQSAPEQRREAFFSRASRVARIESSL